MRILSGIKQECEVNITEVRRNIQLNNSLVQSTWVLIDLIGFENPFDNHLHVDSILCVLYMFGLFDAQTGLIDDEISS